MLNTTASYTVSAWANLADLSTFRTVAAQGGTATSSFYLQYSKALAGWAFISPSSDSATPAAYYSAHTASATANSWTHLVGVFNASTGAMQLYVNGTLAATGSNTAPWTGSGPLSIGGAQQAGGAAASNVVNGQTANVQTYPRALSAAEVTTLFGNGRSGGTVGSSDQQTTNYTYDKRGLPTSMTDANSNTTNYAYDEAGNLAVTTAPAVQVEATGGATSVTARPVTTSGFNTFGDAVEETDPNGNQTATVYDANGNKVSQTLPPYTPAGTTTPLTATSVWTYDSDGNQTAATTPGGRTTSYTYDQLGDVAQVTGADGVKTHALYDSNGEKLSVTDGTGATTQATYDYLGRQLTSTALERFPSTGTLTSTRSYAVTTGNPYGAFLSSSTSPGGVTSSYGYNRAGETTASTDGAGNTTQFTYDFQGNRQKTILPDGTWSQTDYDASSRPTSSKQYDATSTLLTQTSQIYDGVGNVLASTDANGHTNQFIYDAAGTITQQIQPVSATTSITTSFGYDAAGQRTRFTDGRGNAWTYAHTPWGQQQSVTAPTTSTYTSAADSTTTYAYNADGQLTTATQPGGVTTSMTYDNVGQVLSESGQGAEAATATRTFSYDNNGQLLGASTSEAGITGNADHQTSTQDSFGYDDRGNLLTASGSAGNSNFSYNNDSAPLTRADAAGTTTYGYDTGGRLATLNDAATGTNLTYTYNTLSQPKTVKYGTSGQTRTYSYNTAHQLTGDTLVQGASTLAGMTYGYDNAGNLTSKTTAGVAGASANTYSYDWANRLSSWNNGTAATNYSYDASGNRTQVGADVYTYDARDQLTSDGTHTYTYSARSTMTSDASTAGGTVAYGTDAYGGQITAGTHSYTLDATGRNISDAESVQHSTRTFQYSGAANTIASDGNYTYSYDPGGSLTGINVVGAASTSTGVLALTDQHSDVVGTFTSGATALGGSASYDPLGKVTANGALFGHLGFQSGWTESDTGKVGTASRWYNPATGTFMNKDSVSLNPVPNSVSANPFAYVNDNPMAGADPSGQCSWYDAICGAREAYHAVSSAVSAGSNYVSDAAERAYEHASHYAAAVYNYTAATVRTVVDAAKSTYRRARSKVRDFYRSTMRRARRYYHYAARHVRRAYHAAVHAVHSAYHAVSRAVKRAVTVVRHAAHAVAKATRTAYHATVNAVKTAATYAKHHAAAITSFVVSTAVFAGCEAATWGVGTVGCAAMAGAAGSLVEQGFACAETGGGACSVGAFAGAAVTGAVAGALGGALGALGGKLLAKIAPKAMKAVGGLFGKGATEAEETAATDATDQAVSKAETEGAGSRSESGSCKVPHSFTGNTRVLMAGGTTKAIDQIKVGDTIANAVPGQSGTQAHKVTAVIVTHTDHDFVDVTVKSAIKAAKAGKSTAVTQASLKQRVLKKAAVGLAASAAILATLAAVHPGPAGHDLTATAPIAATSEATAQGDHLTTTFHHPFYDETQAAFTEAKDLHDGDLLQTPTGTAQVVGVRLFHANTTTYDLTIGTLHTYYVLAGTTSVLVHNSNTPGCELNLKYKDDWDETQRAAADEKVATLDTEAKAGKLKITTSSRSSTSASTRYRRANGQGSVPAGSDVDHTIDLQLGGADDVKNMSPLNLSVNRSLGPQSSSIEEISSRDSGDTGNDWRVGD
ncbi:RHS repeat-associated core domain-containing protein [Streptomyces sp. H10-C2]|uniref:LamG-like jellyroll fold domain-containing protein n=1 Tax=unclassified Streptomyces TaxID=2593676 RepID=UPI0024BBB10F|nr:MULTISPECIES: LamG-like jellyroll fold domain-containing protein [unclassified Streptomyces]MDJ0344659.1 RHS repeat-associated core domain-containing protein [Streptomyces sp. PH10-H1]MDJ0373181.1 RHS repeat-associated core domain-containing protein [Streptomyces sp. H10-C2]